MKDGEFGLISSILIPVIVIRMKDGELGLIPSILFPAITIMRKDGELGSNIIQNIMDVIGTAGSKPRLKLSPPTPLLCSIFLSPII